MIKKLIRLIYYAFISIVLILIIISGWTSYAFISQPAKSGEIINLIQEIFESQKSVIINVVDLSKLLIKNSSESNNLLTESESLVDLHDNSLSSESSMLQDNGDNPLGIVIEQSLPNDSEATLPEIGFESLDNEQGEVLMNEMEMEMEIEMK